MTSKLAKVVLASLVLFAGLGTVATAAAGSASQQEANEVVRIVDEDVVIEDATITVSDTTIKGPFDTDHHIDNATYTIDSTVEIDGLHLTHDGTEYVICKIDVHIQDVGVHVENSTLESTK